MQTRMRGHTPHRMRIHRTRARSSQHRSGDPFCVCRRHRISAPQPVTRRILRRRPHRTRTPSSQRRSAHRFRPCRRHPISARLSAARLIRTRRPHRQYSSRSRTHQYSLRRPHLRPHHPRRRCWDLVDLRISRNLPLCCMGPLHLQLPGSLLVSLRARLGQPTCGHVWIRPIRRHPLQAIPCAQRSEQRSPTPLSQQPHHPRKCPRRPSTRF